MHIVRTSRLTLEPQVASHAEKMFRVLSDPVIYEYENEPPASVEWLRQRFTKLEARRSPDGAEQWLNWVIRLSSSELIGYVQTTLHRNSTAGIAYVLGSHYWGRGFANEAVGAMLAEIEVHHHVRSFSAVLKQQNLRSLRLLQRLGFSPASAERHERALVEPSELLMLRKVRTHESNALHSIDATSSREAIEARFDSSFGGPTLSVNRALTK